eukprot:CAMPEP_0206030068 /NCGR_PEP_ID=MMETSP1464-20131121/47331_1 /ASSEMBLY_ACC=CAM_ASM_001124 /TAXON_ID=119497 /ORGANISM="Exanthemachrysis gayraliae, Strain RCC1523" /LENGTH=146 /DNA_ID=CAMNT_0053404167 /DNA_START=537 /DNA_END=974 /DNA_ORIENTATION=-
MLPGPATAPCAAGSELLLDVVDVPGEDLDQVVPKGRLHRPQHAPQLVSLVEHRGVKRPDHGALREGAQAAALAFPRGAQGALRGEGAKVRAPQEVLQRVQRGLLVRDKDMGRGGRGLGPQEGPELPVDEGQAQEEREDGRAAGGLV